MKRRSFFQKGTAAVLTVLTLGLLPQKTYATVTPLKKAQLKRIKGVGIIKGHKDAEETPEESLIGWAQTIISNVDGGDWTKNQSEEWQRAARKWLDESCTKPRPGGLVPETHETIDSWVKIKAKDIKPGDDIIQDYDGTLLKRVALKVATCN